jgi:hypothetical protein
VVQELLSGARLLDLRRQPAAEIPAQEAVGGAAFVNFVDPLAYLAFGRRERNTTS